MICIEKYSTSHESLTTSLPLCVPNPFVCPNSDFFYQHAYAALINNDGYCDVSEANGEAALPILLLFLVMVGVSMGWILCLATPDFNDKDDVIDDENGSSDDDDAAASPENNDDKESSSIEENDEASSSSTSRSASSFSCRSEDQEEEKAAVSITTTTETGGEEQLVSHERIQQAKSDTETTLLVEEDPARSQASPASLASPASPEAPSQQQRPYFLRTRQQQQPAAPRSHTRRHAKKN